MTASSQSASFGWFSPLSIHGLQLNSTNDHVKIDVEDIATDGSAWQLLASAPDLGTVHVEKPHVQVTLPLDVKLERTQRLQLEPTFLAVVKDAALTVRIPDLDFPAIEVDGINATRLGLGRRVADLLPHRPIKKGRLWVYAPAADRRTDRRTLGRRLLAEPLYGPPRVGQ